MTTRGDKEPHGNKQVSYRPRHYRNEEIRRASEQTSPQVARAAGHTRKRDEGGGLSSGS